MRNQKLSLVPDSVSKGHAKFARQGRMNGPLSFVLMWLCGRAPIF